MGEIWMVEQLTDIHKMLGKLPKPKAGFTPGKYKYMGPYNPLDEQSRYDSTVRFLNGMFHRITKLMR